jgi:hypothetical protein
MANCSIPNSIPATGRILTSSSRRLKKRNNRPILFLAAFSLANATHCWTLRFFNAQHSTCNSERFREQAAQRSIHPVGRWTLGGGRWAFFSLRRVKGTWWSSRSSKLLSSRLAGRGRFDSYPLRKFFQIVILSGSRRRGSSRRIPWRYPEIIHRDSSTSLGMTTALERR